MPKSGFLVINKPVGERSTRCVEVVRRKLGRKAKVGHGGTLDSTASGVLVLLIGAATRLSNVVMGFPKCYAATLQLGSETDTDDASGNVIREAEWSHLSVSDIDDAMAEFSGWRLQTPPNVSAVHVNGQRAHELSRSGQEVKIAPKPVYFEKVLRTTDISSDGKLSFEIYCQKGTYVRSFGRDLARVLGTAGHVCRLERKFAGPFNLDNAVDFSEIETMMADGIYARLLELSVISDVLPMYAGDEKTEKKLALGQNVPMELLSVRSRGKTENYFGEDVLLAAGNYFSVCSFATEDGRVMLHPSVNLYIGGEL